MKRFIGGFLDDGITSIQEMLAEDDSILLSGGLLLYKSLYFCFGMVSCFTSWHYYPSVFYSLPTLYLSNCFLCSSWITFYGRFGTSLIWSTKCLLSYPGPSFSRVKRYERILLVLETATLLNNPVLLLSLPYFCTSNKLSVFDYLLLLFYVVVIRTFGTTYTGLLDVLSIFKSLRNLVFIYSLVFCLHISSIDTSKGVWLVGDCGSRTLL